VRQKIFETGLKFLSVTGTGRALAPFARGCGAIFMFHQVRAAREDRFQPNAHLEITPDFLKFVVQRIREHGYEIVHLDEAIDLLKAGHGRTRYAVLTFDDGYRDNLDIAYPVLKALGAPFTVFATSGFIDRTSELWWVALERIIAKTDTLSFPQDGADVGLPCRSLEEKAACFATLSDRLVFETSEKDQRRIVRALSEKCGLDLEGLAEELMMSWEELRGLASDPLVSIGGHTHDHFALARLTADQARADILRGVDRLESELGTRPRHFAYPYGKERTVCDRDAAFLAEAGFASAVTTTPGVLNSSSARDLMRLPRISVNGRYQSADYFDQYLTGVPFALFRAARWASGGFGIRTGFSRLFPSTR